jgi:hypothetical protein
MFYQTKEFDSIVQLSNLNAQEPRQDVYVYIDPIEEAFEELYTVYNLFF